MTKTFTTTLMVSAFVLAFSSLALAKADPGTHASIGGEKGGHSGTVGPSAPQSNADGPDTRAIEAARKTQNPGFCQRNPGDYYVRSAQTNCDNY